MYVYTNRHADVNGSEPFTTLGVSSVYLSLWTDCEGISAIPSTFFMLPLTWETVRLCGSDSRLVFGEDFTFLMTI